MASTEATLRTIAAGARRWAMRNRHRLSTEDWTFESDLNGMCAIASAELFRRLQKAGIACQLALRGVVSDGHCFILTASHIVDVTATQFGLKPVTVVPRTPRKQRPHYWRETELFTSVEALVAHQLRMDWWPCQVARK